MSSPRYSLTARLTAAIVSIVVFVAVVEAIVRLAGFDPFFQNRFFVLNRALDHPEIFKKDHDLFWRMRPNRTVTSSFFIGRTYHMNELGLHNPTITPKADRTRIVAMGNSCTFGWGVATENGYVRRLEDLLGPQYQAINAGVPGYTSLQGKRFYQSDIRALMPDIVTILYSFNDHWAAAKEIADKDQRMPSPWLLDIQNGLGELHTYRLLKKLLLSAVEPSMDSLFDRRSPVYRVGPEDFRENLHELCRMITADGARPILLTSPIPDLATYFPPGHKSNLHAFHEGYNEIIRAVAAEGGYGLVDLARGFEGRPGLFDDPQVDPTHFNDYGHRLVAEMIAAYLTGDSVTGTF